MRGMQIKIIIDTDIGEDIDDILVTGFALNSPEFEVMGITTVAGDTEARSRITRQVTRTFGKPEVPVAAGYAHAMPRGDREARPGAGVRQGELAPDETGLPPGCELGADEFIAKAAAEHPGEVYVLTIGAMTNVGQALVRFPETAHKLRAVVTNGGVFGPRETAIGWNLRYDPLAAAVVARAGVEWVLLPENATRFASLREEEEQRLRESPLPKAKLLVRAIDLWRKNKPDATKWPHLSDLNVFGYLLGTWLEVTRGRAILRIPPDRTAQLEVEYDREGPHLLGGELSRERGAELRELFMERILGPSRR